MPFTGSHPAAVIPLLRTPLVGSALVIGSMVPDAPMFGLSPVPYASTHSAFGLVTIDLALGLVGYALWHVLVVPSAIALAPPSVRARVSIPRRRISGASLSSAGWLGLVVVSIVVGATTHVGWDEFTHEDRWGPNHIGLLNDSFHGVAGYKWAQYASSLFGALVIVVCIIHWWRQAKPRPVPATPRAAVSVSCALAVLIATAVTAAVAATPSLTGPGAADLHAGAYAAATRGGQAAVVAILVVALAWHLMIRVRRDRPAH